MPLCLKRLLVLLLVAGLIIVGLYRYYIDVLHQQKLDLDGNVLQHELSIGGKARQFSWYRPNRLDEGSAVIFALHGSNGDGEKVRKGFAYELDELADVHGFIVVYPNGFLRYWNDCRASADYAANLQDINEPAFFKAMIAYFIEQENIDPQRVFVTGMSNGGHMVYGLAMEAPSLFAGFAAIAANLPVASNLDCQPSGQPVAMAILNGTQDSINPHEGGLVVVNGNSSRGEVRSTEQTMRYWLDLAGIKTAATRQKFAELDGVDDTSVILQRWHDSIGRELRLYTLQGSGHVIPKKVARQSPILGWTAGDISGAEQVVDFFLAEKE